MLIELLLHKLFKFNSIFFYLFLKKERNFCKFEIIILTKIIKHLHSKQVSRHPKTPDPMVIMEESRMFKMSPRLIPTTRNVLRSWRASNGMVFVLIAIPPIRWPITSTWGKENWVIEWKLTLISTEFTKRFVKGYVAR